MKGKITIVFAIWIAFVSSLQADEGMWLPFLLKLRIEKMQQMGLELSAEDIYSINNASLKDAIVSLDKGGCTAELISAQGLMLTNHHCGYDEIQSHSSVENDYLTNGFWASSLGEELPNPGKTATFLVRAEDVTEKVLAKLRGTSDMDRETIIQQISEQLAAEASANSAYDAEVIPFFGGNSFFLLVTQTYTDVRLVGAPPSSIGKYGGDTDNWMWPRHTGDFSLFRIYCAPDGSPAEYSKKNVPYTPKHHLPISLKGIKKGDFSMVMGYPGTTDRYLSSWGVEQTMNITNENRREIREVKLGIIKEAMQGSNEIRIKYAAKYSQSSNYWKYSIGQNQGLKALNVKSKKEALESELSEWINKTPARRVQYNKALPLLENSYKISRNYNHALEYWLEALWIGPELINYAYTQFELIDALLKKDKKLIKKLKKELAKASEAYYKSYDPATDEKLVTALLALYHKNVDNEFHLPIKETIKSEFNYKTAEYVKFVFANSILTDKDRYAQFIKNPDSESIVADPAIALMQSALNVYFRINTKAKTSKTDLEKGKRLFLAALTEMSPERSAYPDANSTMRLTYGKVGDYSPRDAVVYKHFTTLRGYYNKENPKVKEFNADQKMKQLFEAKDFGRYATDNYMPVCFTTNNDITGGNSGSPVINGKGQLIGIAFDGNWEAMSGDIAFEPKLQKCINVDIRFVLFVIDKVAGAQNIIDELTIISE